MIGPEDVPPLIDGTTGVFGHVETGMFGSSAIDQYARHLHYEIEMVASLLRVESELDHLGWYRRDDLRRAYLEDVLTHVRGLIEFVVGRLDRSTGDRQPRKKKDIQPRDFLQTDWYGDDPSELDFIIDRIDKEMAHITKARAQMREEDRIWDLTDVGNKLLFRLEAFVARMVAASAPFTTEIGNIVGEMKQSLEVRANWESAVRSAADVQQAVAPPSPIGGTAAMRRIFQTGDTAMFGSGKSDGQKF